MTVAEFRKLPEDRCGDPSEAQTPPDPVQIARSFEGYGAGGCVRGIRSRVYNFRGAADLVIEVLSPSNTATEIYDKERLSLENGAHEFWVVDPERHQVKVSTPEGRTVTYRSGETISLPLFGNAGLEVNRLCQKPTSRY
jgi:hypothetical protein